MFRTLITLALCIVLSSCSPKPQETAAPVDPDLLQPGLSVVYIEKFFRHINEMPSIERAEGFGRPGKPILHIDHAFGRGEVFDSGRSRGIAMQMTGFIHLTQPGLYSFRAMANDGVQLYIDNTLIFEDPEYHSDRLSPTGAFNAPSAGRYPLVLRYFQRKGTATLSLHWQAPGSDAFSVIPAQAYSHAPKSGVK